MSPLKEAPALTLGVLGAVLAAVFSLLLSYGISVTPEQQAAWMNMLAIAGPPVVGIVAYFVNSKREREQRRAASRAQRREGNRDEHRSSF